MKSRKKSRKKPFSKINRARSQAAKKGWVTRRRKEAEKIGQLKPGEIPSLKFQRRLGSLFIDIENLSFDWVLWFINLFRKSGVTAMRFVRKVPVTPKYPAGLSSTHWYIGINTWSDAKLQGFVGSMLVPGVEKLYQMVMFERQVPVGLIERLRKVG